MYQPTTARYLSLDDDGTVRSVDFAWQDPADRNGDGEAEVEAFLSASRDNGFDITEVTGEFAVGPGIPIDITGDQIRVYRADDGEGDVQFFGLVVVP